MLVPAEPADVPPELGEPPAPPVDASELHALAATMSPNPRNSEILVENARGLLSITLTSCTP